MTKEEEEDDDFEDEEDDEDEDEEDIEDEDDEYDEQIVDMLCPHCRQPIQIVLSPTNESLALDDDV